MAVTFRGVTSPTNGTSSVSPAKPTGTVDGDVLLAFTIYTDVFSTNVDLGTVPSGWAKILQNNNNDKSNVYFKIASGEGSSYTWSTVNSIDQLTVGLISYSGTDQTVSVIDANAGGTGSASSTVTYPSVSTTKANTMLVRCAINAQMTLGASFTTPASHNEEADANGMAIADIAQVGTGSTGTTTSTMSSGTQWISYTIALAPSVAGGVADIRVQSQAVARASYW